MKFTKLFYEQYKISGTTLDQTMFIFRPVTTGYFFYDILSTDPTELENALFPISESRYNFMPPKGYEQVFDFQSLKAQTKMKFFRPIPPEGFQSFGLVCAPSKSEIPCNILCIQDKLEQESSDQINCFQPFGQFLQLYRSKLFNFDLKPPLSVQVNQITYIEKEILKQNITQNFNIDLKLPLNDASQNGEFEEQIEDDPARNLKIIQQQQQFACQMKNPNMFEIADSEFVQSATGFELIGIQSLCVSDLEHKENYLYIFKPIAPPGYVALGITVSTQEQPEVEVFCIRDDFVLWTSQAETLGKVYDQETAIYIQDTTNTIQDTVQDALNDESEKEKESENKLENKNKQSENKQSENKLPQMKQIEIVLPKQGQFLTVRSASYPILKPEFVACLKCQEFGSQKHLIKSFLIEPQQELVCEIEFNDQLMQIYRQVLKKASFNYFYYYYRIKPNPIPKIAQEITQMTNQQKPVEEKPTKETKQIKKPDSQATNITEQRVEQTINIPLEMQLVDSGHAYEACACSQPLSFEVVKEMKSADCQNVFFIKLIPPNGFEALSCVVHVGKLEKFNKDQFVCVAKIYLQELSLVNANLVNGLQLKGFALPVGTDEFMESPYKLLQLDQQCHIIRDQILASYFQAEFKTYIPKYTLVDQFDKKLIEVLPRLNMMVEQQADSFELPQLKAFNVPTMFGTIVTPLMNDISDISEMAKFFMKFLTCDDFVQCKTNLFAHPTGFVKLQGEINGHGCYKAICPPGYVALGDFIGAEPNAEKFVLINEQFVDFKFVSDFEWLLTGLIDTDGIYLFQDLQQLGFCFCFEFNEVEVKIPVLNAAFVHYLESPQVGSFLSDELTTISCPRSFLNYLQNYCTNNKTTLSQQKQYDYGVHQFDSSCVLDSVLLQKKCSMVSLAQFKLFSTEQRISTEMATNYISSQKQLQKKEFTPNEDLDKKLLLVDNLIEIMLSLDFGKDLIQTGRPNFFSMKIFRQFEGGVEAVQKLCQGKKGQGAVYPVCGYVLCSDKIPVGPDGPLLAGRPAFFQLIFKTIAKIAGGYKQLMEMLPTKIIELVCFIFGFKIGGREVFTLFLQDDGSLTTVGDCEDQKQKIIIGV